MNWREMLGRIPRRVRLALLAASNLVIWALVAVAVGLLASDEVDLGVESFIRQSQATAVSVWEQVAPELLEATSQPTLVAESALPTESPGAAGEPSGEASLPASAAPSQPTPSQPGQVVPSPGTTPAPSKQESQPEPAQAASQSLTAPASSLLLMTDPDWTDLARLDAEVGRSAVGRPVQIRFHEDVLNQRVAELLTVYPNLPLANARVDLKRDGVEVLGDVSVLGFPMNTKVSGSVVARDCRPTAVVQEVSMAGVLTPGIVADGLKESILSLLSWYPADYPLCIEQIVIEEDRVTIYGSRR